MAAKTTSQRVSVYRKRQRQRLIAAAAELDKQRLVIRSVLAAVGPLLVDVDIDALGKRERQARRALRLPALTPGLAEDLAIMMAAPSGEPPKMVNDGRDAGRQAAWMEGHSALTLSAKVVRRLAKAPPRRQPRAGAPGP